MSTAMNPSGPQGGDDVGGEPTSAAAKLFDIRLLIGGLFLVYGVMLTVAGLFTSDADIDKAAGININLWLGIGMLVVGALFVTWLRLRPLKIERPGPDEADRPVHH